MWDLGKGVNEGGDEIVEGGERKSKKRRKVAAGTVIVKVCFLRSSFSSLVQLAD